MERNPKDEISDLENHMSIYQIIGVVLAMLLLISLIYLVIKIINKKNKSAFSYRY
tara:strand:+ start:348 stop:512 length:165 start_codon:yes stop_codon:yes gene_type:complete